MKKMNSEIYSILPQHHDAHARLINWSRWARPGRHRAAISPMFKYYRPTDVDKGADEVLEASRPLEIDILDAEMIERQICALRPKMRKAIVWFYIKKTTPVKITRLLGCDYGGLRMMIDQARTVLCRTDNFFN